MRLKRLEVNGFKSFVDRTCFEFGPGLTGVVGPNGSGKSNVVEAVRWVLGEQRPKSLRSQSMTDVIFKGSKGAKAKGVAEVSLVIDNRDGELPTGTDEVVVTRRVFRTGEGEYLLNRKQVRLRDIREMLLDTGLGVSLYSFMEQGRIDQILAADPKARRSVFEEAAGISLFQQKKREMLKRLEHTEHNLERIRDLIGEMESRIRSLRIQAGRARRHREMNDRLREANLMLGQLVVNDASGGLASAESSLTALQAEMKGLREARDEAGERLSVHEKEQSVLHGSVAALQEERARLRGAEREAATRADGLQAQIERDAEEMLALRARIASIEDEESRWTKEAGRWSAEAEEADRAGEGARAMAGEAAGIVAARADALERLRTRWSEREAETLRVLNDRTAANNERAELQAEIVGADKAIARAERLLAELEQRHEELTTARADAQTAVGIAQAGVLQAGQSLVSAVEARAAAEDALAAAAREVETAADRRREIRGRVDEAAAARRKASEALEDAGLAAAALWDQVRPKDGFEAALAAVLRMEVASFVLDSGDDAARALEALARGGVWGSVWIADELDAIGPERAPAGTVILADQVRADGEAARVVRALLGRVAVVESLGQAEGLLDSSPDWTFVTRDGALASRGRRAGGVGVVDERAAQAALGESGQDFDRAVRARDQAEENRDVALESLLEAQRTEASAQTAQRSAWSDEEAAEAALVEWGQECAGHNAAVEEAHEARREAEVRLAGDAGEGRAVEEPSGDLEDLSRERSEAERVLEEVRETETQARRNVERLAERSRSAHARLEHLGETRQRAQEDRERSMADIAGRTGRAQAARIEVEKLRDLAGGHLERLAGMDQEVGDLRRRMDGSDQEAAGMRLASESATRSLEEAMGRLQEVNVARERMATERDEILRRLEEEYGVTVADLTGADASEAPAADDLREEIGELRGKLARLGPVNEEALADLDKSERRLETLKTGSADVDRARGDLQSSLERLETSSRERFTRTFEQVQEAFVELFRKLFRGGRGDLSLEEGADPLDGGIEVTVRPPGKGFRSIDLLSGGERTLTALAILFAIFKTNPSPFCLLDEVDAALDDANVERFLAVLGEFMSDTQFIVVTHNKRTMAECDTLFGITMPPSGVSRTVSVELEAAERYSQPALTT